MSEYLLSSNKHLTEVFLYFKKYLSKAGVDRAVFYGILARGWGICAGPITALLIATKFTPNVQGYYYTFANLLALQVFVELGLGTVIVQFASHEWSKLSLDKNGLITGDDKALSKLISLARVSIRWYFAGGIVLILGLGIGGTIFFSGSNVNALNINWLFPWLMLCLLTGLILLLVPIWSLLEGCNQVNNLYAFRLWQGLCTSLSLWAAMLAGAELWTVAVSSITTIICALIFLKKRYWKFLKTLLFSIPQRDHISWYENILPMQWRIAVSWISGYFVFSFFTPVLFKYHGPVAAGQFGMTWSVIGVIGALSNSWLAPRVPQFGILISQRKYKELNYLFWKITKVVTIVGICAGIAIWLVIYALNRLNHPLSLRLAAPLPAGLLILAQLIVTFSLPFAAYMRAHKEEPLMGLSVISGSLIGLSTFILGKYYGIKGMAIGYLTVNAIIIPLVIVTWYRCRKEWHI
ncbi:MAG: hypothetical protein HZA10_02690 [Nitrospirae bacterium]|nr:hypothetical protein [Nitrospirota bacterium]